MNLMVQELTSKIEQILDSQVKIEAKALDFFKSAETVGTGSEQTIAHGLLDADFNARIPLLVWTEITSIPTDFAGNVTIVQGTHDATNIKITAHNDADFKYIVYAI